MIYPKKKIRSFGIGGAMGSLFNNPGTYMGIQYIPTAIETPDIEGLQYVLAQNEARRMQTNEAAAKVRPDMTKITEALSKVKGLTGEQSQVVNEIERKVNDWNTRYDTAEKMISSEALSDQARIYRDLQIATNGLQNNRDIFDKQYAAADSSGVMSNIFHDKGMIYVPDRETGKIKGVSSKEYYEKKDSEYENTVPLTVKQVLDYRMNNSRIGEFSFSVNQYSAENMRKYIDDHFKSIATNLNSISGGEQLKGVLAQAGLDPEKLDIKEFKMKLKSGEINANVLYQVLQSTMDPQAQNTMMSQMQERGINPYKVTGKDAEGNDVTAFDDYLHLMYLGEKAKKSSTETEIDIKDSSMVKSAGEDGGTGGDHNVLGILIGRNQKVDDFSRTLNIGQNLFDRIAYNPFTGKREHNVRTLAKPNLHVDDYEKLLSHTTNFRQIDQGQVVYANGHEVRVGKEITEGGDSSNPLFYWTPQVGNFHSSDFDNGSGQSKPAHSIQRTILVNKTGLKNFKDDEGKPLTAKTAPKQNYVREIKESELNNMLKSYGSNFDSEEMFRLDGWNKTWIDGFLYAITVDMPLDDLSGFHNTINKPDQQRLNRAGYKLDHNMQAVDGYNKYVNSLKTLFSN